MNKEKIMLMLMLCLPVIMFAQTKGIQWNNDLIWENAIQKARKENKFLFVDCYATWCGPCKIMDKYVYTDDTIATFVKDNFIAIKLQFDSSKTDNDEVKKWYATARMMEKSYSVKEFPSFLFFSPGGELVNRDAGLEHKDEFL